MYVLASAYLGQGGDYDNDKHDHDDDINNDVPRDANPLPLIQNSKHLLHSDKIIANERKNMDDNDHYMTLEELIDKIP